MVITENRTVKSDMAQILICRCLFDTQAATTGVWWETGRTLHVLYSQT